MKIKEFIIENNAYRLSIVILVFQVVVGVIEETLYPWKAIYEYKMLNSSGAIYREDNIRKIQRV